MRAPALLTRSVAGAGVHAAHHDGEQGVVVGLFARGCYVRTDAGIYAITGAGLPPGPIHLALDQPAPPLPEGAVLRRTGGLLRAGDWELDLERSTPYRPAVPDLSGLLAARRQLREVRRRLVVPEDLAGRWPGLTTATAVGDLFAAREQLQGRGGGLTPTGDDVLAGLLLVAAWSGEPPTWLGTLADGADTTDLARAFLIWSARGQSIAPVHRLLSAAEGGDAAAVGRSAADVAGIGGSSGPALLWGLCLAVEALPEVAR